MLTRCVNPGYFGSSLEEGGSGAGAPKPQPVGVGTASLRPPIIGFHANQTKTARKRNRKPVIGGKIAIIKCIAPEREKR